MLALNTRDPKQFWDKVNGLGPNFKKKYILLETVLEEVIRDIEEVLEKWKCDYEQLFSNVIRETFDEEFFENIKDQNSEAEARINDYVSPELDGIMNEPISQLEVTKIIKLAKSNKVAGCDGLPNEVYKSETSIQILCKLFNHFFNTGLIPSTWKQAIIKPISKGSQYDPRIPLNYRGISLLPTMYKLYTSLMNNRLAPWLEDND